MDDRPGGRYELVERIGAGGMAEVWRARDTASGAEVALKRLHPRLVDDPSARGRFVREIEAARSLDHPSAVHVLDADTDADDPWLAMELLDGSLADRLAAGPMAQGTAVAIVGDVAGALAALHATGTVHRDVTPSNILLTRDGHARLADFGIARPAASALVDDLTATGDVVGTLRFLAPEVLAGAPASFASDTWSLGAVLFEAIAGRPPFDASSPTAFVRSQQHLPPPLTGADPAVAWLVGRMLDPDAALRPPAADVARRLHAIGEGLRDTGAPDDRTEPFPAITAASGPAALARRLSATDAAAAAPSPAAGAARARRAQAAHPRGARSRAAGAIALLTLALLAALALAASPLAGHLAAPVHTGGPATLATTAPSAGVTPTPTQRATAAPTQAPAGADGGGHGTTKDGAKGKGGGKGKGHG